MRLLVAASIQVWRASNGNWARVFIFHFTFNVDNLSILLMGTLAIAAAYKCSLKLPNGECDEHRIIGVMQCMYVIDNNLAMQGQYLHYFDCNVANLSHTRVSVSLALNA